MNGLVYGVALDVGSEQDFSAITILRRREMVVDTGAAKTPASTITTIPGYDLIHIKRFELRTKYQAMKVECQKLLEHPEIIGNAHFIIDASGVGNPVVEIMAELAPIPIVITAGNESNPRDGGGYTVPKRDLVTRAQSVMQTGRVRMAHNLPELEQFKKELLSFTPKQNKRTGNTGFESSSESIHDDIVMSFAINIWFLEKLYGYEVTTDDLLSSQDYEYDPLEMYQ